MTFRLDMTFDRKERFVRYQQGTEPRVQLSRIGFDLRNLFAPGSAWDRAVYRANPYMPDDDKRLPPTPPRDVEPPTAGAAAASK